MAHYCVVGLGFGDEGKGSIVDWLCRSLNIKNVVRFSGGPQAAHHVVMPDGLSHCFASFGSGTLYGAKTFYSPNVLVSPEMLAEEGRVLKVKQREVSFSSINISDECPIITPFHVLSGKIKEIERNHSKSSCGKGIGETVDDILMKRVRMLYYRDLKYVNGTASVLKEIGQKKAEELRKMFPDLCEKSRQLVDYMENFSCDMAQNLAITYNLMYQNTFREHPEGDIIFEGSQGMLLQAGIGEYPYITKTDLGESALENAKKYFNISSNVFKIGVLRSYMTRHGNGPFPTSGTIEVNEKHNYENEWQGSFRTGWLDLNYVKKGFVKYKPDALAITCMDRLYGLDTVKVCTGNDNGKLEYMEIDGWSSPTDLNAKRFFDMISEYLGIPVKIVSSSQTYEGKFWC